MLSMMPEYRMLRSTDYLIELAGVQEFISFLCLLEYFGGIPLLLVAVDW